MVLAGVNGSGKTTILELINKLFDARYRWKGKWIGEYSPNNYANDKGHYILAKNIDIELKMLDIVSNIFEQNTKGKNWTNDYNAIIQNINKESDLLKLHYKTAFIEDTLEIKENEFLFLNLLFDKSSSERIYYIPAHTNILEPIESFYKKNNQSLKDINDRIKNELVIGSIAERLDFREYKQWVEQFIIETAT